MPASDRRLPFRVPLAEGQVRCRLKRIGVSLEPATFEQLRQRAIAADQPMSWIISDLLERALRDA